MQTVNVTVELLNGILAYLGSRPFSEVYQIVNQIQAQAQPQLASQEPVAETQPE